MATLLALTLASTQAAVIPMEEVMDQLQSFLAAPEETLGVRMKRSTGDWDKEIDLTSTIGVLFQIKYTDIAHPLKGGHAHVKFPGAKFISGAPFDNVDLDIVFNGGDAVDGIFDMKITYKFIQKFMMLADRAQEGTIVVYRKMEGGEWKTKFAVDNAKLGSLVDIALESDYNTKVHAVFNYEGNVWEVKMDRVPHQSFNLEFIANGQKFTGVATIDEAAKTLEMHAGAMGQTYHLKLQLNPAGEWGIHITGDVMGAVNCKWTMQKDFKMGQIIITHKGQNFVFMQLKGEAEMTKIAGLRIPMFFDYVMKYTFPGHAHDGKAKMKFDLRTAAKTFDVAFVPNGGTPITYHLAFDLSTGFKYTSTLMMAGATVEKATGELTWSHTAGKLEIKVADNFEQTPENPFYHFANMMAFGHEVHTASSVHHFMIDTNAGWIVPALQVMGKAIVNEKVIYHFNYDNTTPKKELMFSFLPHGSAEMWTYEGVREQTGTMEQTLSHKVSHGDHVVQEVAIVFNIKTNDANMLEIEHVHTMTLTEEAPFYGMTYFFLGKYAKSVERKVIFKFDKVNKSIMFFPKMAINSVLTLDGQKTTEFIFDNNMPINHIKYFFQPAFSQDHLFEITWEYTNGMTGLKYNVEFKRGGVATCTAEGDYKYINTPAKFEITAIEKLVQTEASPLYAIEKMLTGKYFKNGERTITISYNKANKNFLLGKFLIENKLILDGKKHAHFKVDTTATPYTLTWFHEPVRGMLITPRDIFGQDTLTISAVHIPGTELMIETNLPNVKSIKISGTGTTKKFELNGNELATVDFDPTSKMASTTVQLPTGQDMTLSITWPKLTAADSDLVFSASITPNRELTTKFGWKMAANWAMLKTYIDIAGKNPSLGDYKLTRNIDYKYIAKQATYKIKVTGHVEATKGLVAFSPMETNVLASINTNTHHVDAIVKETIAGKTYGFTMTNEKFMLLTGN